jgi:hypothetical protein
VVLFSKRIKVDKNEHTIDKITGRSKKTRLVLANDAVELVLTVNMDSERHKDNRNDVTKTKALENKLGNTLVKEKSIVYDIRISKKVQRDTTCASDWYLTINRS